MSTTTDIIKTKIDIVEVINNFVALKKKGSNYLGNCPFHNEKTPSFVVSPAKQIYKCYGCGKSGDSIQFIVEQERLPFYEAVQWLAQKYNVELPKTEFDSKEVEQHKQKASVKIAMQFAQAHFASQAINNNAYVDFLQKRGITPETAKHFGIGYCSGLLTAAKNKGYEENILFAAGLISESEKGYFDSFYNRITYPIKHHIYGHIIGFGARTTKSKTELEQAKTDGRNIPKFLNSKETQLYHKEEILYNFFEARYEITNADLAIIAEGYNDVISLHQAGVKNVVATCGTALTEKHLKEISRLTKRVAFMFDGDIAGSGATQKAIKTALSLNFECFVIPLPKDVDPDDFCRSNKPEDVIALVNNAIELTSYIIALYDKNETVYKKGEQLKNIQAFLSCIADKQTRDLAIENVADELKIQQGEIKLNIPKNTEGRLINLSEAQDEIKSKNRAYIYVNTEDIIKASNNHDNIIYMPEHPIRADILKLKSITTNIFLHVEIEQIYNPITFEDEYYTAFCKKLIETGFDVSVLVTTISESQEYMNFCDFYITQLTNQIELTSQKSKSFAIEKSAEIISLLTDTQRITYFEFVKNSFKKRGISLNTGDFKKVLNEFVDKRKKETKLKQIKDDSDRPPPESIDINNLPDYVDKSFFIRNGYFEVQNSKGQPIYYMMKWNNDNLFVASDFTFRMLGHVWSLDSKSNKRLLHFIKEDGEEKYLELLSSECKNFQQFNIRIYELDSLFFYTGPNAAQYYEKVLKYQSNNSPKLKELKVLGHNQMGFYAASDGIFDYEKGEVIYFDKYGRAEFKGQHLYNKTFSVFNDNNEEIVETSPEQSVEKYNPDKCFVFNRKNSPVPQITKEQADFNTWIDLITKVYTVDNGGIAAFLFSVLTAFRDILMNNIVHCPLLLLSGETSAGKTQIAESIMNLFALKFPSFNLISGTDSSFFTSLEYAVNFPFVGEEYNEIQISNEMFQGLKQVLDGVGRQKMAGTNDEKKFYQVNTSVVFLGQEIPERDDMALFNRSAYFFIDKKQFSEKEDRIFKQFKNYENAGLQKVLITILSKRKDFVNKFVENERQIKKAIKAEIERRINDGESASIATRVLNTCSEFVAAAKTFMDASPELKFPFTLPEIKTIFVDKAIRMSNQINSSNRIANFFETISHLINTKKLTYGKEFIVYTETPDFTVKRNGQTIRPITEPRQILHIRLSLIFKSYRDTEKAEALKLNNLRAYLENHKAFRGSADDIWFRWAERTIVSRENATRDGHTLNEEPEQKKQRSSSMCFIYDMIGVDLLPPESGDDNVEILNNEIINKTIMLQQYVTDEKVDEKVRKRDSVSAPAETHSALSADFFDSPISRKIEKCPF